MDESVSIRMASIFLRMASMTHKVGRTRLNSCASVVISSRVGIFANIQHFDGATLHLFMLSTRHSIMPGNISAPLPSINGHCANFSTYPCTRSSIRNVIFHNMYSIDKVHVGAEHIWDCAVKFELRTNLMRTRLPLILP
jgi:hypothetical protein